MKLSQIAAAAAVFFGLVAGANASTTILDISATSGVPVSATFGPGTYTINWIDNTAKGGYNGWIYNTGGSYREAFTVSGLPNIGTLSVDKYVAPFTNFQSYSTAAAALAAVQSGPYVVYNTGTDGSVLTSTLGTVGFTLDSKTTLKFGIPDAWLFDNCCGVSLAITSAAAGVPEPGSYPLVLAGIGALAFFSRRRKSV